MSHDVHDPGYWQLYLLMGLDFHIKTNVVVDVDKGWIQVKQGQRNNVQILPLNMVNLLQLEIDQNKCIDEGHQDETLQLWGIKHQPLGEAKVRHGIQNKDLLNIDESTLPNGSKEVEKLMENELNLFV